MANQSPGTPDHKKPDSDFIRGALSSVVEWFPSLPKPLKWFFTALFLWYVFASLAQISPSAPFKLVYEMVDDSNALASERRDEFVLFLTKRLDEESAERLRLQSRYESLISDIDGRLRALEESHRTPGQVNVPRGTQTKK